MKRIPMSEEELNEQQVTLKPVLGIHPEKYIRIIYLILALFLFFLVFFLPGIMKNGTYYTISTTPGGASVYADGIRLGASPGKYFIEKGKRTITVKSPYHETWESEVKVKGRTFGTLFLKRNRDMAIEMVSNITPDFISEHHLLTASWFQSDEGFSSLQLPPHMQDLFKAYYRSSNRNSRLDDNLLEDYLASLLRTAAYDNSYYQWLEAFALFETKGKALNSSNLLTAAANAAAFVAENPELLNLLTEFHDVSGVSAAAAARSERLNFDIEGEEIQLIPSDPLKFIPVASLYSSDENWTYYIADREITKGWYLRFLEDNPRWSLPEKDKLIDAGLVDDNYLLDWEDNQLTY
ncbi:MAG: PEGA domain-containing protein, partial [Spirochaetales bacterium]|nr:PEGA domain-containing protein [Spirochaetales bacterium]